MLRFFKPKKSKNSEVLNLKNPCVLQFFEIEPPNEAKERFIIAKAIINDSNGNALVLDKLMFPLERYKLYSYYKKYILNKLVNIDLELLQSSLSAQNPLLNDLGFESFFNCKISNFNPQTIDYVTREKSFVLLYQNNDYKNVIYILEKTKEYILNINNVFIEIPNILHDILIQNSLPFYEYSEQQKQINEHINIDSLYSRREVFINSYYYINETKLNLPTILSLVQQFCLQGLESDELILKLLNIKQDNTTH